MEVEATIVGMEAIGTGAGATIAVPVDGSKVRVKISAVNTTNTVPNKMALLPLGVDSFTGVSFEDGGGEWRPIIFQATFPPLRDKLRKRGLGRCDLRKASGVMPENWVKALAKALGLL